MAIEDEQFRLPGADARHAGAPGVLRKLLSFVTASAVLVLALTFSLVLFAVLLTIGLLVGGYIWWRLRQVRRQMEQASGQRQERDGRVIEGEVVRGPSSAGSDPRE